MAYARTPGVCRRRLAHRVACRFSPHFSTLFSGSSKQYDCCLPSTGLRKRGKMSQLTAEKLRKLLHENELHLQSDEKEIALMNSAGVPESVLGAAPNGLGGKKELNA